jgi:cell division protein FtsA
VAVGKAVSEGEKQKLHIIGVAEVPSEGVNRGIITSIDDAVKSVSKALDTIERKTGFPVESAWVGISGGQIISQESKGVVAVSKVDGEISDGDIERAMEAARTVTTPPNYEILHVIPRSFVVDGQEHIKDPIGMSGIRLEVDTYIIEGLSSQIKNLTKCVYQTGVDIEDLVLSILATSEAILTSKQKELGVVAINIGAATTSLAVFEQGDLLHAAVLPIGSEHITSDVAIGLRTSLDIADEIKLRYGAAVSKGIDKKEEINLAEFDEYEEGMVSKKYVAEIIEARVDEIFEKVAEELKRIGRNGVLPAGAILTGGGAQMPKIIDSAKKTLCLPASLGYPLDITSVIDEINDLNYTTAIGLIKWGSQVSGGGKSSRFKSVNEVTKKMKKWVKALMP